MSLSLKTKLGLVAVLAVLTVPSTAQAQNKFTHVRDAAISGYNKAKVRGSIDDCKAACLKAEATKGFVCLSFDYNKNDKSCDLSDKNRDDFKLKTNYTNNPYDYYERQTTFERVEKTPDLNTVWDSNLGPVYWLSGHYGNKDQIFSGKLSSDNSVFEGNVSRWDSRRGPVPIGKVALSFGGGMKGFIGHIRYNDGSTQRWAGQYRAGAAYSGSGISRGANSDTGNSFNKALEAQVNFVNPDARRQFETYESAISPTTRCDAEMIDFLKKQGLSNPSITKFCR